MIGDCAETLKNIETESVDLIVTDPPYGYRFMNLDWDKALPSIESLKQCLRVLKHGAFAFFMCSSRTDLLWRMGERLEKSGLKTGFSSVYWTYARGQPKINKVGEAFAASSLKPATEAILVCMKQLSTNSYTEQYL